MFFGFDGVGQGFVIRLFLGCVFFFLVVFWGSGVEFYFYIPFERKKNCLFICSNCFVFRLIPNSQGVNLQKVIHFSDSKRLLCSVYLLSYIFPNLDCWNCLWIALCLYCLCHVCINLESGQRCCGRFRSVWTKIFSRFI